MYATDSEGLQNVQPDNILMLDPDKQKSRWRYHVEKEGQAIDVLFSLYQSKTQSSSLVIRRDLVYSSHTPDKCSSDPNISTGAQERTAQSVSNKATSFRFKCDGELPKYSATRTSVKMNSFKTLWKFHTQGRCYMDLKEQKANPKICSNVRDFMPARTTGDILRRPRSAELLFSHDISAPSPCICDDARTTWHHPTLSICQASSDSSKPSNNTDGLQISTCENLLPDSDVSLGSRVAKRKSSSSGELDRKSSPHPRGNKACSGDVWGFGPLLQASEHGPSLEHRAGSQWRARDCKTGRRSFPARAAVAAVLLWLLVAQVPLGARSLAAAGASSPRFPSFFSNHHQDFQFGQNATVTCPESCLCTNIPESEVKVDCTGLNLTQVPRGIPTRTTFLDLSMNSLSSLPANAFSDLTSLQHLRLASNKLQNLPRNIFRNNRFLTSLYLQDNEFKTVPKSALKNLSELQQLTLALNNISKIPDYAFRNLTRLVVLLLNDNRIQEIGTYAFSGLKSLTILNLNRNNLMQMPVSLLHLENLSELYLAFNDISKIPDYAFKNLTRLLVLLLNDNRIQEIADYAFLGLKSLQTLNLNRNKLTQMPVSLAHLENLSDLHLEDNQMKKIPDHSFSRNSKLTHLQMQKNPITSVGTRAFAHLPYLKQIMLPEVTFMHTFPDLNGTNNLTEIRLDRASISVLPDDICTNRPKLIIVDVHSNRITMIPNMSTCSSLLNLNMGNNHLMTLEGRPLKGLSGLRDLTLSYNYIKHIPADAFLGLTKLQYLDLNHNQIVTIDREAFVPLTVLEDLSLGHNHFATLPTKGLQNLLKLKVHENENFRDFPPIEEFPKVHYLVLSYAYHCCDFLQAAAAHEKRVETLEESVTWLSNSDNDISWGHYHNLTEFWTNHLDNHTDLWGDIQDNEYDLDDLGLPKEAEEYLGDYKLGDNIKHLMGPKPELTCKPKPGPFMPCDDLFGWWSLRCGVWFVFLLALLGNAVVLFVSVTSRSKMDVPRFLICNLACADFCMGVYLGILAMVDASTLGEFRKHAIPWQMSGGCLVAGFLGVLSSELSVFTLTVITLERSYAITHAMQLNKRLSLKQSGYIMLGGWLWSCVLASLPLFRISDYRKFAVCLPFEVEDDISKSYVVFILIFNGLAFSVILGCYMCMYLSIRHSQAWNSNDTRVAKRMALLVFTDFLCWAPIAFFSLGAAFGVDLIDLGGAKVLTIFVLPLNSCANPFLYAIFTKQFKRDCVLLCRRLEDTSIARHFSRVSNRHASFTWGSSRRASQLNSLVNGEKVGSISNSQSSRRGGVLCHSDPDSGKGSLDYEKVPQSDPDLCPCQESLKGVECAEEGTPSDGDYQTVNVYNEMLSREACKKNLAGVSPCHQDVCPCRDRLRDQDLDLRSDVGQIAGQGCRTCLSALRQQHQQQSEEGSRSQPNRTTRLSSDDYNCTNCTTETYLPGSEDGKEAYNNRRSKAAGAQSAGRSPQRGEHQLQTLQHQKQEPHRKVCKTGTNFASNCCSCQPKDCSRKNSGHHAQQQSGKDRKGSGSKKSRKDLVIPVVSFSKSSSAHVSVHVQRCLCEGSCCPGCHGAQSGLGDGKSCLKGALNCCGGGSTSSSPVDDGRGTPHAPYGVPSQTAAARGQAGCNISQGLHSQDAPDLDSSHPRELYSCRTFHDQLSYVSTDIKFSIIKADDTDSGHGVGIADGVSGEQSSCSLNNEERSGRGSVEAELHRQGEERQASSEPKHVQYLRDQDIQEKVSTRHESAFTRVGSSSHSGSKSHAQEGQGPTSQDGQRQGSGVSLPQRLAVLPARRQRAVDKTEYLRFFADSLAAHPHACRSNSLVELSEASQARISAPLHREASSHPVPPKRLSLTPRQEGYLLLNSAAGAEDSPYLDDEDHHDDFPPYEELQRYLQASEYHAAKHRAPAQGVDVGEEVSDLLSKDGHHEDGDYQQIRYGSRIRESEIL